MCSECTRIALKRCEIKIFLRSMPPDTLGTARHWHSYTIASFPGPSRGVGERAWYILHAHAPGDPRKMWGNRILSYTLRLSSIELYVMQNPRTITMVTRLVAMEIPAHARAVCTRPFLLLLLKGLGTRLTTCIPVARSQLYLAQSHDSLTVGMYKCHNCWVSSLFNLNRPHNLNNQSDPTFVYAHPYRCIHPDPSESRRLPQVTGPFSQGWGLGMRLHLCDDSMNRDGSDIPYM